MTDRHVMCYDGLVRRYGFWVEVAIALLTSPLLPCLAFVITTIIREHV